MIWQQSPPGLGRGDLSGRLAHAARQLLQQSRVFHWASETPPILLRQLQQCWMYRSPILWHSALLPPVDTTRKNPDRARHDRCERRQRHSKILKPRIVSVGSRGGWQDVVPRNSHVGGANARLRCGHRRTVLHGTLRATPNTTPSDVDGACAGCPSLLRIESRHGGLALENQLVVALLTVGRHPVFCVLSSSVASAPSR